MTVDDVIEFLNSLLSVDADAMTQLVRARVPCNDGMAEHPTVQVDGTGPVVTVGMLGILNGMFGVLPDGERKGWGYIGAVYGGGAGDEESRIIGFVNTSP